MISAARIRVRPPRRRGRPRLVPVTRPPAARRHVDLERLADGWQLALDAADRALDANRTTLAVAERRKALVRERATTAELLAHVAETAGVRPRPWLAPVAINPTMLGLPATTAACVFDLDGVLTDSGALHARAWAEVFDEFLMRMSENTDWPFIPFDVHDDYASYIDGRPRIEGIHTFLASRGIRVPEGRPGTSAQGGTANGLARHKRDALERTLRERGVAALPGVRRYLEAAGRAGLRRAVISASTSTASMLERAGLDPLIDAAVDADVIHREQLRSRPAPDVLLAACRYLDVEPAQTVAFTTTPAGIAAGRAARIEVVGVADRKAAEVLRGFGAELVVPHLGSLLDARLGLDA
jgi:HAD superfamily hydrolase (TIGR01509 family)